MIGPLKSSPLKGCKTAEIVAVLPARTGWGEIWPLLVIGAASIPLGLWVFGAGERYAKRNGKLKRSG